MCEGAKCESESERVKQSAKSVCGWVECATNVRKSVKKEEKMQKGWKRRIPFISFHIDSASVDESPLCCHSRQNSGPLQLNPEPILGKKT